MALYAETLPPLGGMVEEFLSEDIPSMDIGGQIVGSGVKSMTLFAKSPLVTAGYPFAEAILKYLECKITWIINEGEDITAEKLEASGKGKVEVAKVEGPVNRLLQAERTVLEVLVRASSVAKMSRLALEAARGAGYNGAVAGTRKTTPGRIRLIEKYGLLVGGVDTHRYSLSHMVMLKDNHIDASGGITPAVKKARQLAGLYTKIEVECRTVEDAKEACAAGADIIMLDNFTAGTLPPASKSLREAYPNVLIEVSGGINPGNVAAFVSGVGDSVDIVSMGCLTQCPPGVDYSLKIDT